MEADKKEDLACSTLTNDEIYRYSRQLILPFVGVTGQLALRDSSVLIVGAGGLGCPCSLYLVGCGIGRLGLIDYDEVDLNNIHRQVLYTEENVNSPKVSAASEFLRRINSNVIITSYKDLLTSANALDIISQYDIVVDATDNVPTRYLLNDACVLSKRPLVSGSALQMEGQLTVYNYNNGPCYRCIFPNPPPAETVTNCGDGGVLGVIPGVIGVLQALEVIKIILKTDKVLSSSLFLFDGENTSCRKIKLRTKNPDCAVCGENSTIKQLIDYELFCGSKANDKNTGINILSTNDRISVTDYKMLMDKPHVLIDVRSKEEFQICKLADSVNVPITDITKKTTVNIVETKLKEIEIKSGTVPVFVICRRGNDSQKAVLSLRENFTSVQIKDIIGGLHAWSAKIDNTFPVY